MDSERLREAAHKIRAAASGDIAPGPWKVTEDHGRDINDEGWSIIAVTAADGAEVAATAYPGGPEDAADPLADATLIALMASPLVARALADLLDAEASMLDTIQGTAVEALVLADVVLSAGELTRPA
jgi:autotransporter adhesin